MFNKFFSAAAAIALIGAVASPAVADDKQDVKVVGKVNQVCEIMDNLISREGQNDLRGNNVLLEIEATATEDKVENDANFIFQAYCNDDGTVSVTQTKDMMRKGDEGAITAGGFTNVIPFSAQFKDTGNQTLEFDAFNDEIEVSLPVGTINGRLLAGQYKGEMVIEIKANAN